MEDQRTRWANRLIAVVAVMAVFWYASWWLDRRTEPARWRVDPSAELSATSDTIPIVVNESGCASGRSSEGRIDVDVFYGDDTVRLAVGVRPLVDRDQDCPGNPDTPYDVRLSEPLGERTVVGENWPGDEAEGSVEAAPRVWLFPTTGGGELAGLGGTLAYDRDLDCLFVEESDEAVVWPAGTVGTSDGPGVVLPSGDTARVGDRISGTGGHQSGSISATYGIAPECVTDSLAVFQFSDVSVSPPLATGLVAGTFTTSSGLGLSDPRPISGTMTAIGPDGERTTTTATEGAFEFELPPGTYLFEGFSESIHTGGAGCVALDVVVPAGETTAVEVSCLIR